MLFHLDELEYLLRDRRRIIGFIGIKGSRKRSKKRCKFLVPFVSCIFLRFLKNSFLIGTIS